MNIGLDTGYEVLKLTKCGDKRCKYVNVLNTETAVLAQGGRGM